MKYVLLSLLLLPMVGWSAPAAAEKCTLRSKTQSCVQRVENARSDCEDEGVVGKENVDVCVMARLAPKGKVVERDVGMERVK